MIELKLWLHLLLCSTLFVHCFYRQQTSSAQTTRAEVRTGFGALASASLWFGVLPLLPAHTLWPGAQIYEPSWSGIALLAAFAIVQTSTARPWQRGVPKDFQKCSS